MHKLLFSFAKASENTPSLKLSTSLRLIFNDFDKGVLCTPKPWRRGGQGGIRTPEGTRPTGLQPVPFGRSGTYPFSDITYHKTTYFSILRQASGQDDFSVFFSPLFNFLLIAGQQNLRRFPRNTFFRAKNFRSGILRIFNKSPASSAAFNWNSFF